MEYVYSAMVLHAAKKPVTEENITSVLKAAGVEVDATRVKALTAALEGVDIDEATAAAVAAPTPVAAQTPAAGPDEKKDDKKKEEKKEEKVSEEEAAAGLSALFG